MAEATSVKLDGDIRRRLQSLGKLRDRSVHWLMRAAVVEYLEREEAYERERQEDEERWQRYLLTGDAVENEVVLEWLDSIGTDSERPCPR